MFPIHSSDTWDDVYPKYSNLIITHFMHVSNTHMYPHKYVKYYIPMKEKKSVQNQKTVVTVSEILSARNPK